MSVLVIVENSNGSFKKKSFEAVHYAAKVAEMLHTSVTALALGTVSSSELENLGNYGATQVLHATDARLDIFNAKAHAKVAIAAVKHIGATVVIATHDNAGKAVAPRVAANLMAGFVAGAVSYPDVSSGFTVKRNVFSGKAFANIHINSAIKVLTITPNSFQFQKTDGTAAVEVLDIPLGEGDFTLKVTGVEKETGAVPLAEAELVVSGGRGLKGPENWHILEDLAKELGAATACSRPVADSHWRPHHEHVGQTGGTIRPNLYIAIGISGAIQHLAGVNGSKHIVVINKDPEAPFFKAADYGVLGDALEIVPRLTEAVKKYNATK
jgi:electron transfer flavoprotein alpha subunit